MRKRSILLRLSCLAIVASFAGARITQGDTISVHDLSHNITTGVYSYTIELDAAAKVKSNDGFAIYDFLGLASWSITGGLTTSQFSLTQTGTSNTLNDTAAVDSFANIAALTNSIPVGNLLINNLSFSYGGPPTTFTGATSAVLTITSIFKGADQTGVYASVDHSGINSSHPFGNAEGPLTVPAVGSGVPLPRSFWGGSLLFAVLAGLRVLKNRSIQA